MPLRRRPARPAWTGSPTRKPSTIPAVEIPEEIRARAAANGYALNGANGHHGANGDGPGAILTPPGSGGDVHGDPGVEAPGGAAPNPPGPGGPGPA